MVLATRASGATSHPSHVHVCAAYMNCGASVITRVILFVWEIITINLHYLILSQIDGGARGQKCVLSQSGHGGIQGSSVCFQCDQSSEMSRGPTRTAP